MVAQLARVTGRHNIRETGEVLQTCLINYFVSQLGSNQKVLTVTAAVVAHDRGCARQLLLGNRCWLRGWSELERAGAAGGAALWLPAR